MSLLGDYSRHKVFYSLLKAFSEPISTSTTVPISTIKTTSKSTATPLTPIIPMVPIALTKKDFFVENLTMNSLKNSENQLALSLRHRSLIGEAMSAVIRRAGTAAPPYISALISVCIKIVRIRPLVEEDKLIEKTVNLNSMIIRKNFEEIPVTESGSIGINNKKNSVNSVNNVIDSNNVRKKKDKIIKSNDDNKNYNTDDNDNISLAAYASDRALLRQSAMSLLADSIVSAGWSASNYLIDILDVATGMLSIEGMNKVTQTSTNIRRFRFCM